MELSPVRREDIQACGKIMHKALTEIAQRHNFPPDFPNPAAAEGLLSDKIHPPAFEDGAAKESLI